MRKLIRHHVTWRSNLRSIKRLGLIPNYKPNPWGSLFEPGWALEHSCLRNWFCTEHQAGFWAWKIGDLNPRKSLVVLVTDLTGIKVTKEYPERNSDIWTNEIIPPERIMLIDDATPWSDAQIRGFMCNF